jgi:hypothetical protein
MLSGFLNSKDWAEIKNIFAEEMKKMSKGIDYQNKSNEWIGQRYIANREAEKIINRVVARIEMSAKKETVEKKSYV